MFNIPISFLRKIEYVETVTPKEVVELIEDKFKIIRAELMVEDLRYPSQYFKKKRYLVIYFNDGTAIPYYKGDYSSLTFISKECDTVRSIYNKKVKSIELVMESDNIE